MDGLLVIGVTHRSPVLIIRPAQYCIKNTLLQLFRCIFDGLGVLIAQIGCENKLAYLVLHSLTSEYS